MFGTCCDDDDDDILLFLLSFFVFVAAAASQFCIYVQWPITKAAQVQTDNIKRKLRAMLKKREKEEQCMMGSLVNSKVNSEKNKKDDIVLPT